MKERRAIVLTVFLSVVCVAFSVCGFLTIRKDEQQPLNLKSAVQEDFSLEPYINEDSCSFFIPSGMNYEDLFIVSDQAVYCNGKKINNTALSEYAEEEEKIINIDDLEYGLFFYRSENVPALFIDTLRADTNYLNADKNNRVDFRASLFDSDGKKQFSSATGVIKGRGNNSWDTKKKSYNLNFNSEIDLLEMGKACRWVLVPNSSDNTKVYNKTVYDFASETGLYWTPECKYVDLYLNGVYNGLYLLTEKIEADEERLDLGKNDLLLKRELPMRLDQVDNGFKTENGNVIEITYPNDVTPYHKEQIQREVQKMEDAIFDLDSDEWKNVIDMDSWARCYLIDELFDNLDAGIASANYYLKDGKFYRGPVWDYDSIMLDNPKSMIANTYFRQPYSVNDYYYLLNQREEFLSRVKELFQSEFRPLISEYVDGKIDQISNGIIAAREMDGARWNYHFVQSSITNFKYYLNEKAVFMEEYWANRDRYCKVLVQSEIFYRTFMVEKGKSIRDAINLDMSLFENNEYHYAESDQAFSLDDVVDEDVRLDIVFEEEPVEERSLIREFGILNIAFLLLFAILFLYVIIKGIIRNYVGY